MLTIEKHYEENIQLDSAKFLFRKVGIVIKSDKQLANIEELEKHSNAILEHAKVLVKKELQSIREEYEKEKLENGQQ